MIRILLAFLLLYTPALSNFFSADDWFHLRITQISSFSEFLNFFSFTLTPQSASFYRPLPTQLFFFTFQEMFGLVAWPYHLFVLLCFGFSLYLVYRFSRSQLKSHPQALTTMFIYGLSVSNFTRVYFLSAFQEISLVIFSLLTLIYFPRSRLVASLFFVLALMSKETAVVIPALLLLFHFNTFRKHRNSTIPIGIILLVYLFLRFVIFGNVAGDTYIWDLSPFKAANTLFWYILWALGAPEFLVDYVGSGLRIIPKLFLDFPFWWMVLLPLLAGTVLSLSALFVLKFKHINQALLRYALLFLISLSPVLFLPYHKFALELGLPLVGSSMAIAWVLSKKWGKLSLLFICFYVSLNLVSNFLTYPRHYAVGRADVSQRVFRYFQEYYPVYLDEFTFEFMNDGRDFGDDWGQSKQVSQSLSGSDFFKVFYRDPDVKILYQDEIKEEPLPDHNFLIYLGTQQFISKDNESVSKK